MWTMLAGVPGKLKVLADRLTSTRAANLDRLDANVSTRAAASTALSNAVWTDARAGKLDLVAVRPLDKPPVSAGLYPLFDTPTRNSLGSAVLLDVTGQGVVNLVAAKFRTDSGGGSGGATYTVEIDGSVVFTYVRSDTFTSGYSIQKNIAGSIDSSNLSVNYIDQIPFNSSFRLLVNVTKVGNSTQAGFAVIYRKVS